MFKTPTLNLSLIAPSQAQKHLTVNESFVTLDQLVQLSVQARNLQNPPQDPQDGACYIIPEIGEDNWGQAAHNLAFFLDGAWRYIEPKTGWRAWSIEDDLMLVFNNDIWETLTSSDNQNGAAIPESFDQLTSIGIGTQADSTNRLSLKSPASLFDYEQDDHRLNINKREEADNCSLIFQSQYTGHAEMGLSGSNEFKVNVSEDGQSFNTAIHVAQNGDVTFPQGHDRNRLVSGVLQAGGADTVLGPPNLLTVSNIRSAFSFTANIVYFYPFYVDRPTHYLGGACAAYTASSTAGSLIRAALYELGQAVGSGWRAGAKLADLGTATADEAGHKTFELDAPLLLQPGWYLHAIGTNGAGLRCRALEWMTPGAYLYMQYSSGTGADFRITGIGKYLHTLASPDLLNAPLPENYSSILIDRLFSSYASLQLLVPKWQRWD